MLNIVSIIGKVKVVSNIHETSQGLPVITVVVEVSDKVHYKVPKTTVIPVNVYGAKAQNIATELSGFPTIAVTGRLENIPNFTQLEKQLEIGIISDEIILVELGKEN